MKYKESDYLNMEYFELDDEHAHNKMKIVTTRKDHPCMGLVEPAHIIPAKSKAILETAIHCDDGRVSCYLCFSCADKWLDLIIK